MKLKFRIEYMLISICMYYKILIVEKQWDQIYFSPVQLIILDADHLYYLSMAKVIGTISQWKL